MAGLFREEMDYKSVLSATATDSDIFNDDRLYHSSFRDALDILKNNADYSLKLVDDFDMESAISENYRNEILECCEIAIKYKGYIEREKRIADKIMRLENLSIPEDFDFDKVESLSIECRQKLKRYSPRTIAQASRISGVSPADISVLLVYFGR